MIVLQLLQAVMMIGTLVAYRVTHGAANGYEEFCLRVGASFLWFITWPMSIVERWRDRRWRKQKEKENKLKWDEP